MGAGRCRAAHRLPLATQSHELGVVGDVAQSGEELVLFFARVGPQECEHGFQTFVEPGRTGRRRVELRDELVDALVLELDARGQRLAVLHRCSHGGPEHRLLGEGVREDEAPRLLEDVVAAGVVGAVVALDEPVELRVVTALPHEDARLAAELLRCLVGDGSSHRHALPDGSHHQPEPRTVPR
jgi:hypothetical protein